VLTVSNIAWCDGADPDFLCKVAEAGFDGIDLAPTKVWPGWQLPGDLGGGFRANLEAFGLGVVGMQSLFFGAGPLNLFAEGKEEWRAFVSHMDTLYGIAAATGASKLVFGAPANRDPGVMWECAAWNLACERLRYIGDRFSGRGVSLCLEPVPEAMNGKFLRSTKETVEFLRQVDHPGIRLNLDTAVLFHEAVDITSTVEYCGDLIAHVHASEPALGDFSKPLVDHLAVRKALQGAGYAGAIAIEMAAKPGYEAINLARALDYVGAVYA